MDQLRGAHVGETATILGLGPSILKLQASDFPAGPVITINHAVLRARRLRLPNVVYAMSKDGCTPHGGRSDPPVRIPISRCVCPSPRVVQPIMPEHILLSAAESSHCCARYALRHVFDVELDFGLPWNTMSVPVAARIAHLMGCSSILMLGHDAYTRGVYGRVSNGRVIGRLPSRGYRLAAVQAKAFADGAGIIIEFR
jgi:hypothetical protein